MVVKESYFRPGFNYDELKVEDYTLPHVLLFQNGAKVENERDWRERRLEILKLFENEIYGRTPQYDSARMSHKVMKTVDSVLNGNASLKEIRLFFDPLNVEQHMDLLVLLPKCGSPPHPAFWGLNFCGNHTITSDPNITITSRYVPVFDKDKSGNGKVDDTTRGFRSRRYPLDAILSRGYAFVTACYGDLALDCPEQWMNGIHTLFSDNAAGRADTRWGALGAWSFGLSVAMDYFEKDEDIDERRVACFGHSRLGKAALWAAAQDERIAIAIANNSGHLGSALSRRRFGETIKSINARFPHWLCPKAKHYDDNESALPMDQHMLLSLIAPRPLYVASAEDDLWADPKGEFLGLKEAENVYKLYGEQGLGVDKAQVGCPVGNGAMQYHVRSGEHDLKPEDWLHFLDFVGKFFKPNI